MYMINWKKSTYIPQTTIKLTISLFRSPLPKKKKIASEPTMKETPLIIKTKRKCGFFFFLSNLLEYFCLIQKNL
jgi:hypothetical protein